MGFFKNFLGVATQEDWPDMMKYNAYFTDILAYFMQLDKDYNGKFPRGYLTYLAVLMSACDNREPKISLKDLPVNEWNGVLALMFKPTKGTRLCNDSIEKIAMIASLVFCKWNMQSTVVYDRLTAMARGTYSELLRVFDEDGLEKCYMDSYLAAGLNDYEKMKTSFDVAAERCAALGIQF